jgi:hypothetical protein
MIQYAYLVIKGPYDVEFITMKINDIENKKGEDVVSEGKRLVTLEVQREIQALFLEFPELQPEIPIEKIGTEIEIIGVGAAGIVLEDKRMNTVMKVGRNEQEHTMLKEERENHEIFSYLINKEKRRKNIPHWIKIPKMMKIFGTLYKMIKVNGPSLYQLDLLFNPYLKDFRDTVLMGIHQEREGISKEEDFYRTLYTFINIPEYQITKMFPFLRPQEAGDRDAELAMDLVFPEKAPEFRKVLRHLKDQGIEHADLHSGNVLLDKLEVINSIIKQEANKEVNFYIIDFGKINIDEERVKRLHPEIFYF